MVVMWWGKKVGKMLGMEIKYRRWRREIMKQKKNQKFKVFTSARQARTDLMADGNVVGKKGKK